MNSWAMALKCPDTQTNALFCNGKAVTSGAVEKQ